MGPPGPWRGAAQGSAQSQVGGPGLEWVSRGSPAGRRIEAAGRDGPLREPLCWAWAWSAAESRLKGFVAGSPLPSPWLVFKREREETENVLPSKASCSVLSGPGQAVWGRASNLEKEDGPSSLISRFVYTFLCVRDWTSPRPGAHESAQMLGGGAQVF